jgi:hypothetical protein
MTNKAWDNNTKFSILMMMEQLKDFLQSVNYLPVFNAGIAIAGLLACGIIVIMLLHTLHIAGQRTPLYRKHEPVKDWSKRFYPASGLMIIFLLILMWLLNVWSHKIVSTK